MEDSVQQTTTVQDAHDRIHLAWSLLSNFKLEHPKATLDIAIYMFRQALLKRPRTLASFFDIRKRLVYALCRRFMLTRRDEDLSELLQLCWVSIENLNGIEATNQPQQTPNVDEPELIVKVAAEIVANFLKPTSIDTLNKVIVLLDSILPFIPHKMHPNRVRALVDLGVAHYFHFCHSSNIVDLNISISSLQDALESCTQKNFTRFYIALQLCAVTITRSLHRNALSDFQEAVKTFKDEHDPITRHPFAMTHEQELLKIVQSSPGNAVPDASISLMREILANRLEFAEHYDEVLHQLAEELFSRFQRNGLLHDLEEAVLLFRRTLALRPPPHMSRSDTLESLALALATRFDRNSQNSDLDELVSLHREAVTLRPGNHPGRSISLHNLSLALASRSKVNRSRADIDDAVLVARESLELRRSLDQDRCVSITNLANALLTRFSQGGNPLDLDEAISLYTDALTLSPTHPSSRLEYIGRLAAALCTRFERTSQPCDIDRAISLRRDAVKLCPASPALSFCLSTLARELQIRFGHSRQQHDLDEAILAGRNALDLRPPPHPNRPESLNGLASALNTRFDISGQVEDLDEAILLLKEALDLWRPSSPGRYVCIGNLATCLRTRFEEQGAFEDLEEAIVFYRAVIQQQNGDHPDKSVALTNLANAVETRFQQRGDRADLDEAISLNRQAVEFDPPDHPDAPRTLHNLAVKIYSRFEQTKNWEDNDEVISLERLSLIKVPAFHLRSNILSVLANALANRHGRTGEDADLDEAVSLHKESVGHPNASNTDFMNLATALIRRSALVGHEADLDEAILILRRIVQHASTSQENLCNSLVNLASALGTRFGRAHQRHTEDIEEAISLHQRAIELLPKSHVHRHTAIFNLAVTFLQAHLITQDAKYLNSAMTSFADSLDCASQCSSDRLRAAIIWARHANETRHNSTFKAYDEAMQGLSQVAALSLNIQARQDVLRIESDGLARSAARYAIEHRLFEKAIEYLEEGRAVFWSQVLHLRSPFDEVASVAPDLAERMRAIAAELECGSHRNNFSKLSDNVSKMSREAEATRLRQLDDEWFKGLGEVRAMEGFEDFLRPKRLEQLRACAVETPVAYLVPDKAGSDCIIMAKDQILHIPLPNLPTRTLNALVHMLKVATSQLSVLRSSFEFASLPADVEKELDDILRLEEERASRRAGTSEFSSDSIFQYVLNLLWRELVKPVIKVLRLKKSENPPIIRWCPTGLFAFLPIHAAGCYNSSLGLLESVSDYLVSSYIPNAGVISGIRAKGASKPEHKSFRMMAVVDTGLPFATVELNKIKTHVPTDCLVALGIPGVPVSVEDVYNRLPVSSVVHFACHGTQDRSNPLNSGLHVNKGMFTISKILQQSLPRGSLVFLCACQTATGDETVPDEAMSIGASLLFAGFRSVVATMWNIADADGPIVADVFYGELFRGLDGKLSLQLKVDSSARYLHISAQHLRSTGVEFRRWVPFIHLG